MKLPHIAALKAIVLATALPLTAQASSMWHPAPTEEGFTYHPDHFQSTKTRAQVMAEVEAALKDGTRAILQRGAPLPIKSSEAPKTRQQVVDEMRSESPEARRARLEMYSGG